MSINTEIGARLRNFGESKFPSMAAFSRALQIKPQQLYDYFNGKSKPGNKMQSRLRDLGCDIGWLITGETKDETQKRWNALVEEEKKKQLTDDEYGMIAELRRFKIKNTEQLNVLFDTDKLNNYFKEVIRNYAQDGLSRKQKKKEGKSD